MKLSSSHSAPLQTLKTNPKTPGQTTPSATPDPSESPEDSFGPRVLGAFTGAIMGGLAGKAGPQGVVAAAGIGGGLATASWAVPTLGQVVKDGLTGNVLHDVATVASTTFAGSVLVASAGAGAAALAYPIANALPGASTLLGAVIGAAAGAKVGIWN